MSPCRTIDRLPCVFHPNLFDPILRPDYQSELWSQDFLDFRFPLEEEKREKKMNLWGFGTPVCY